jgi:hypothetical protein
MAFNVSECHGGRQQKTKQNKNVMATENYW